MPPRKKPETPPEVPATPAKPVTVKEPVKPVTVKGPVKVRHKQSGKTFIVSKQYFEKHGERLEVING